jgi:hypothetical protein
VIPAHRSTLVRIGGVGAVIVAAIVAAVHFAAGATDARSDRFGLPVNKPITRAELGRHAEARLDYPGSRVVKVIGSDEIAKRNDDPDPAYAGAILVTTASPAQLYAWYAQWLTARGYQQVTYYRMSDQPSGVAWRAPRGREQVQIAVFDRGQLYAQQHHKAPLPAGGLVYEELLVGYRVDTR